MFSELVGIVVAPFLLSVVTAAQVVPIVLPQDVNYVGIVSNTIAGGDFVSDPTVAGRVLAVEGVPPATTSSSASGGPLLVEVVRPFCVGVSGRLSYRIILRNADQEKPVVGVTVVDTHPNMQIENIRPAPTIYSEFERKITWEVGTIGPLGFREFSFDVPHIKDHVENRVVVTFSTVDDEGAAEEPQEIVHYELVSDNCQAAVSGEVPPEFPTHPLPPNKESSVVCEEGDPTCTPYKPKLGVNFDNARPYQLEVKFSRPIGLPLGIQVEEEEEKPKLGVRFEYATIEPLPGDCRVIGEEDIPGYEFLPDVQVTWCDSGEYPERLIRGAPEPVKAKFGSIRLPDTSGIEPEPPGSIDAADKGVACRGLPGDPWWASDCSCQCGDFIFAPGQNDEADAFLPEAAERGIVVPCGFPGTAQITRHDIYVTSQAECLNDTGHEDPRF